MLSGGFVAGNCPNLLLLTECKFYGTFAGLWFNDWNVRIFTDIYAQRKIFHCGCGEGFGVHCCFCFEKSRENVRFSFSDVKERGRVHLGILISRVSTIQIQLLVGLEFLFHYLRHLHDAIGTTLFCTTLFCTMLFCTTQYYTLTV